MNILNRKQEKWIRPWNKESFDDLFNRDDRFFALVIKGALSWLTRNIVMYNKPIKHFILQTGSSYLYVEQNGYEFNWSETSGEDMMYMSRPRCTVDLGDISVDTNELTQGHIRGTYERVAGSKIQGFNAEFRRIPINISLTLNYVLSNLNESIVLIEELLNKMAFQKYYKIAYLGQLIECSIEIPTSFSTQITKLDMTSTDTNQKTISLNITVCTNYPLINEDTEISNDIVIGQFISDTEIYKDEIANKTDDIERIVD